MRQYLLGILIDTDYIGSGNLCLLLIGLLWILGCLSLLSSWLVLGKKRRQVQCLPKGVFAYSAPLCVLDVSLTLSLE